MSHIIKIDPKTPEDCPFRYIGQYYDSDDEYCTVLSSGSIEDDRVTCCCTEDRWLGDCPLMIDDYLVMYNN